MNFKHHHSILRQLIIPLVLSFAILILMVTGLVFFEMKEDLENSIENRLASNTKAIKTQLKSIFISNILNISAWAKLEIMDNIINDDIDGQINRSLKKLKSNYHLPGNIMVFNQKKQLISSSSSRFHLKLNTITPPEQWFHTHITQPFFIGKHINPYTQKETIAFIYPIRASFDNHRNLGFIVLTHPWSNIEQVIFPKKTQGILLNQSSRILASNVKTLSANESILPDKFVHTNRIKLTDNEFLFKSTKLSSVLDIPVNWTILSLEDYEKALQPVWDVGIKVTVLALILTSIITYFIIWQTRRVVLPIQKVTRAVLDIAQSSDLSKRMDVIGRNETAILAHSFNLMAKKLAKTMSEKDHYSNRLAALNKTLEQQVAERTEAYRTANEQLQTTIKQLKQAQTQLIQSEKLASLGQLVAGIAHEINNPLGAINANIPILTEYTQDLFQLIDSIKTLPEIDTALQKIDYDFIQEDTPQLLASMKNAASRMKEIVLSLRNFSRLDQADVQEILLEEAIDTTLALLSHRLKNRITVIKHYHLNRPVPCYAGLINQVLMNLLANAEQAIENKGKIIIGTNLQDDHAIITIEDTGVGMDSATLHKIFDPFFTTKPVGEGTGMGLSISYGIIEKHQGELLVSSQPGIGSIFTIRLPIKFNPQQESNNNE